MTKLNIILNSFKNSSTRKLAIVLGLCDLTAVVGVIIAIVKHNLIALGIIVAIYAIVFAIASKYVNILNAFTATTEDSDEEIYS